MGTFSGTPPTYDILKIPGTPSMRPPMFGFAKNFGDYLQQLIGQPAPAYGGSLDPGMSPTMQMMGVLSQMYANSPLPAVYGQAHGSLSRFLSPSFTNPMARMQYGAPSYFGNQYGAGQWLPGGMQKGDLPYAGGMRPFSGFTPGQPSAPTMPYGPPSAPSAPFGPQGVPGFGPTPAAPYMGGMGGGQTGMPQFGPTPVPGGGRLPYGPTPSYGPTPMPPAGYTQTPMPPPQQGVVTYG